MSIFAGICAEFSIWGSRQTASAIRQPDSAAMLLIFGYCGRYLLYASLLIPVASRNLVLYQSLPNIILYRQADVRRRKDDTGMGTAARRIVERLYGVPRRVPA